MLCTPCVHAYTCVCVLCCALCARQVGELVAVLQRLGYDKQDELTYAQVAEGLQWLGYK